MILGQKKVCLSTPLFCKVIFSTRKLHFQRILRQLVFLNVFSKTSLKKKYLCMAFKVCYTCVRGIHLLLLNNIQIYSTSISISRIPILNTKQRIIYRYMICRNVNFRTNARHLTVCTEYI